MSDLTQAMLEYASAVRGDWSNFDGRTERDVIEGWVAEIETPSAAHTLAWWRNELGLCPEGNGHWMRWCDEDCPTYAAEQKETRQ